MDLQEYKQELSKLTGVPVGVLDGETPEEVISRANEVQEFKKEIDAQREAQKPKTTKERFVAWFDQVKR